MPEPPPPNVAVLLIALGRHARTRADAGLGEHGLTYRHLSALGHLARQPELSYSELGRRAGVSPQSMQATLAQLEQSGAVERATEAGRGRTARLHVTPRGQTLLQAALATLTDVEQQLTASLPPGERDRLAAVLLTTLRDVAQRD